MKKAFNGNLSITLSICVLVGCGDGEHFLDQGVSEGAVTVCYRGDVRVAEQFQGDLYIEGDIIVADSDQWCTEAALETADGEPIAKHAQAVRKQGDYAWPNGRVPFKLVPLFDDRNSVLDVFTASELTKIQAAMDAWEAAVPGLRFVDATSSDTDFIEIRPHTQLCQSALGRVGGMQRLDLASGCFSTQTIQHEMAHALGILHEQTRKDRDDFVVVQWGNILGCPSSATEIGDCNYNACKNNPSDCGCSDLISDPNTGEATYNSLCGKAGNFTTNSSRSDILDYDLNSIMHYYSTSFTKGGSTLTTVDSSLSISPAFSMTELDAAKMRTLYPVLEVRATAFATAGIPTKLCDLQGRRYDDATVYRAGSSGSFSFSGDEVTFSSDVGVTTLSQVCEARSNFWLRNYDYPNSDETEYGSSNGSYNEDFETEGDVTVMTSGLVPVLL